MGVGFFGFLETIAPTVIGRAFEAKQPLSDGQCCALQPWRYGGCERLQNLRVSSSLDNRTLKIGRLHDETDMFLQLHSFHVCISMPKCEVVGSEIEDTNRGGQNFVKLGVDVQCLASCCVSQLVCHKILLRLSFKDQILNENEKRSRTLFNLDGMQLPEQT